MIMEQIKYCFFSANNEHNHIIGISYYNLRLNELNLEIEKKRTILKTRDVEAVDFHAASTASASASASILQYKY